MSRRRTLPAPMRYRTTDRPLVPPPGLPAILTPPHTTTCEVPVTLPAYDPTAPLPERLLTSPRVLDLFAGPGGWDTGVRELMTPRGIDRDADACETGRAAGHYRHPGNVAAMDPRAVLKPWGQPAGIIGSPPCPGFSRAGLQLGNGDARLLLDALPAVSNARELEQLTTVLDRQMMDDRTLLAIEPLRWALHLAPRWLAWEQVPSVLPLWDAAAVILRGYGYTVATGIVQAEAHGVAQSRARAVLVARDREASFTLGPAKLPTPTHSRYFPHAPEQTDPGLPPARSMALELAAHGWTERDRVGFLRRDDGRDEGLEVNGTRYRRRDLHPATRPAPALTEKARSWSRVRADGVVVRVAPGEAARLQSFPEGYPFAGSRTAVFRQIADAVPPRLAYRIVAAVMA